MMRRKEGEADNYSIVEPDQRDTRYNLTFPNLHNSSRFGPQEEYGAV
jgi:hypothetical protein